MSTTTKQLWKTEIVIWTDYDPQTQELSELAREAESGDGYCAKSETIIVDDPESDADAPDMEFFFGLSDEDEDDLSDEDED